MSDGNGKFLRGVFWALLIGSFGWATTMGAMNLAALNGHCAEAKIEMTSVKSEMITRDELMLKEITKEFKEINSSLIELKTDIKYVRKEIQK